MARKSALSKDSLKNLGAGKLAQLVLDEIERNTGFRRQVKAALAGKKGPEAVAKLIDRRLAGLERAQGFIDWDKARAFSDDLRSLVGTIASELGPSSPALAIDRLLRFIATHEQVFDRIDDSSGAVQDVYYQAIAVTGDLVPTLGEPDADFLPNKIMAALGESTHGYLTDLTRAVVPHLLQETLAHWDADLAKAITLRRTEEAKLKSERWYYSITSQWSEMRQIIAAARGDLDLLIGLETQKQPHMQDTLGIASQLLETGRAAEALDWVRKPGQRALYDNDESGANSPKQVSLEARILEALDDKKAAQALRWRCFESRPSASILREYLKGLPDFEDVEAEERAHDLAFKHRNPDVALQFFIDWPRLDLAAKLIVEHRGHWDGGAWHILPEIAGLLEHEYPLAAAILYRVLLDDILARARSKAYSHGAKYLKRLTLLAKDADSDPSRPADFVAHPTYLTGLKRSHPRKSGFWALVS